LGEAKNWVRQGNLRDNLWRCEGRFVVGCWYQERKGEMEVTLRDISASAWRKLRSRICLSHFLLRKARAHSFARAEDYCNRGSFTSIVLDFHHSHHENLETTLVAESTACLPHRGRSPLQTLLHTSIVSNMHDMKHGAKAKGRTALDQSFTLTLPGTRQTVLLGHL
jgi:hypothetical protein